ncbi:hypothetical protein KPH14_003531 [Odynerus spinipes]|uniref:Uncharacterized protein n=1 Tax=Odynerus spinipes TaxID=1348599 RepID=A0AAD9RCW8_9HYME|nr:hypothetical protein KPH14_003531 [Odynerus spinipes]
MSHDWYRYYGRPEDGRLGASGSTVLHWKTRRSELRETTVVQCWRQEGNKKKLARDEIFEIIARNPEQAEKMDKILNTLSVSRVRPRSMELI